MSEDREGTRQISAGDAIALLLTDHGLEAAVIDKIKTDLGAATVEDLSALTEADLVGIGMKKLPARKLVADLKPVEVAPTPAASPVSTMSFDSILPNVPTDSSWLEALRTGGVLKVDQSTVIGAIRAALAHKARLYDIPDGLVTMLERFAEENEEQVDVEFFKLKKQLTRRNYAEIFSAIEGLDGSYVTEGRKKQLFGRIDEHLWPSIETFYGQLKGWQEAWLQGGANPMIMMSAIMAASGGGAGVMPPGVMQPPDTGGLRDHADAVADAINKCFAGTGVQIASALAYDATKIRETLENPRLPALVGAANRDQMLRQLGVAVSATYPRLETNLTRFVLSTLQVKDQAAGTEELQYFSSLFMLGSQIPWDQLGNKRPSGKLSGIGVTRRDL